MRWKWIFLAPLVILGIFLFMLLGGTVVQYLWNWLLPPLFGWHQINFWQALGLLALCRILFGGRGWHGGGGRHRGQRDGGKRCGNMTPEEKARFRERMRERFGFGPSTSPNPGQ